MRLELPLSRLFPGKLNPRHHFDEAALAELAESIARDGVLENLIVRPGWCVGTVTSADLAKRKAEHEPEQSAWSGDFEIVSGERRYRAATKSAPEVPVPVLVKPMTDPEALRINLMEQMQRNQLTALEESEGFAAMLAYRDENGQPLHTPESLASSLGKSHDYVLGRLDLRELPSAVKKAMNAGIVHPTAAARIARIPDKAQREEAGELMIKGGRDGGAMTLAEVVAMIAEKFMVQLKGAPFDQEDEHLVPEAGKCSVCPHRSGNLPDFVKSRGARTDVCTNTACFRAKCGAAFNQLARSATELGATVLDDKASAKLFESTRPQEIRFDCDWVELDTRPLQHLLKSEVKSAPMWRELAEKAKAAGMTPEIVLAKDGAGRGRWLVNSAQLMAASEKLGEPIFAGQKGDEATPPPRAAGEDDDENFRRGQRELAEKQRQEQAALAEAAKLRELVVAAQVRAVHAGLAKSWIKAPIWDEMLRIFSLVDFPTQWVLHAVLATKETDPQKLVKLIRKQSDANRQSITPLLFAAKMLHGLASGQVTHTPAMNCYAALAGVDLKAVEKAAVAGAPAKRKSGKAAENRGSAKERRPRKVARKVAKTAKKTSNTRGGK